MSKFRALELAIDQATRQRDAQARKQAQAQRGLQFAQEQLAQLENYSKDIDTRWIDGRAVNLSGELIKHHYQFMERLQGAVTLQQGVVENLESQLGVVHQAVLQAEYRLAGIQSVLKARLGALGLVQQRRDQRVTDEFAAMLHARRGANREECV